MQVLETWQCRSRNGAGGSTEAGVGARYLGQDGPGEFEACRGDLGKEFIYHAIQGLLTGPLTAPLPLLCVLFVFTYVRAGDTVSAACPPAGVP